MPKKSLQAQGYYKGAAKIWIPKAKQSKATTQGQQKSKQDQKKTPKPTSTGTYQWKLKQVQPKEVKGSLPKTKPPASTPYKVKPRYQRYTREGKGKWIPQTSLALVKVEEQVYQPIKLLSIKERAATLGVKLFGWGDTKRNTQ